MILIFSSSVLAPATAAMTAYVRFDGDEVTGIQDRFLRKITAAAPAPAPANMEL